MAKIPAATAIFALGVGVFLPVLEAQEASRQDTSGIDREAIAALNRMGAYLRTLKAFQIKSDSYKEEVLVDGQKIQLASAAQLLAQAPDKLRLEVNSDRAERHYLYDGAAFTIYDARQKFYATAPAPSTIPELIKRLEDKYDMDMPFADLFRWGGPESKAAEITAALDMGNSQIDGTTCEHYVFRQPGLDWQVWIQLGDFPLPRKLVLTTTDDDARPQFGAVYTWNLAPSFNGESFKFIPPPDSHKIVLVETSADPDKK